MQKLIVFIFSLLLVNSLKAQLQNPSSNSYSLKLAYSHGTHFITGASLNHINKKGYSISGQVFYESRDANNIPDDFVAGGFFGGTPFVYIESIGIAIGKVLVIENSTTQFNLQGGLSLGRVTRPVNFKKQSTGGLRLITPDNYSYDFEKKQFVGLILNPTVDLLVSRLIGFSFGLRTNINHQDITAGFEVGLLLGYLRGSLNN